jgi:hypothetical protein
MVIYQLDIQSVSVLKPEDQTPVTGHGETPITAQIAPQGVQTPSWENGEI